MIQKNPKIPQKSQKSQESQKIPKIQTKYKKSKKSKKSEIPYRYHLCGLPNQESSSKLFTPRVSEENKMGANFFWKNKGVEIFFNWKMVMIEISNTNSGI